MRAEESEIAWPFLEIMLKQLEEACERNDHALVRLQLLKIVSEYQPASDIVDLIWLENQKCASPVTASAQLLMETTA
jgi:hypothetical protein